MSKLVTKILELAEQGIKLEFVPAIERTIIIRLTDITMDPNSQFSDSFTIVIEEFNEDNIIKAIDLVLQRLSFLKAKYKDSTGYISKLLSKP